MTIFILGFFGYYFKDKFLVGLVNNQPIFKFQLSDRLYSLYGRQVLEDLIAEKLIYQEAKKKGITVFPEELTKEIDLVKERLGQGTDLDSLLTTQGVKKSDFESQLKIQILVKKLLGDEISISEEEIGDFIKNNKKLMMATTEAELRREAEEKIRQREISQRLNLWIGELFQKAKITRFLK